MSLLDRYKRLHFADNVKANFTITGKERKNKDGVKYMDIKDFTLHFQTSRLHLYFHQLIGGPIGKSRDLLSLSYSMDRQIY